MASYPRRITTVPCGALETVSYNVTTL